MTTQADMTPRGTLKGRGLLREFRNLQSLVADEHYTALHCVDLPTFNPRSFSLFSPQSFFSFPPDLPDYLQVQNEHMLLTKQQNCFHQQQKIISTV